jgi:hypothetical protein
MPAFSRKVRSRISSFAPLYLEAEEDRKSDAGFRSGFVQFELEPESRRTGNFRGVR